MAGENGLQLHNVFKVDPCDYRKLIGVYVDITLKSERKLAGVVYTVDPVSESIVIMMKEKKTFAMQIVLKHAVKSIKILSEMPVDEINIHINEMLDNIVGHKANSNSNKEKEEVKSWLIQNMIPVIEEGDILKLDSLEIHPPYNVENCHSNNTVVLDRVQNLLGERKRRES